jgi:hypothetical protein
VTELLTFLERESGRVRVDVQPISEPFTADADDLMLLTSGTRGVAQLRALATVGLTRQLGRPLQAALVARRTHSTGNFDTDIFTENRVSLIVSYTPQGLNSKIFDPVTEFRYFDRPMRGPLSQPGSRSVPGTP